MNVTLELKHDAGDGFGPVVLETRSLSRGEANVLLRGKREDGRWWEELAPPGAPLTCPLWEYRVLGPTETGNAVIIRERVLCRMGLEGWELCAVDPLNGMHMFKRLRQ